MTNSSFYFSITLFLLFVQPITTFGQLKYPEVGKVDESYYIKNESNKAHQAEGAYYIFDHTKIYFNVIGLSLSNKQLEY